MFLSSFPRNAAVCGCKREYLTGGRMDNPVDYHLLQQVKKIVIVDTKNAISLKKRLNQCFEAYKHLGQKGVVVIDEKKDIVKNFSFDSEVCLKEIWLNFELDENIHRFTYDFLNRIHQSWRERYRSKETELFRGELHSEIIFCLRLLKAIELCHQKGGDVVYLCFNHKKRHASPLVDFLRIVISNSDQQRLDYIPSQSSYKQAIKQWLLDFFLEPAHSAEICESQSYLKQAKCKKYRRAPWLNLPQKICDRLRLQQCNALLKRCLFQSLLSMYAGWKTIVSFISVDWVKRIQYQFNSTMLSIFLYVELMLVNSILLVFLFVLSCLGKSKPDKKYLFVVACGPETIYWDGFFNLLKTFQNKNESYDVLLLMPQKFLHLPKEKFSKRKKLQIFIKSCVMHLRIRRQTNFIVRHLKEFLAKYPDFKTMADHFNDPLEKVILSYMAQFKIENLLIKYIAIRDQSKKYIQSMSFEKFILIPHLSSLGEVFSYLAKNHQIQNYAFPAVTVAGNHASLVGWDRIDQIGCYGEQAKNAFTKMGHASKQCILTGNISFDHIGTYPNNNIQDLIGHKLARFIANKHVVMIATSGIDLASEKKWVRDLIEFCKQKKDYVVLFKPHPSLIQENTHLIKEIQLGYSKVCKIVTKINADRLVYVSDVCITDNSTVGSNAVLQNKPLIVANYNHIHFKANDYVKMGVACLADHSTTIQDRVVECINTPRAHIEQNNFEKFVNKYNIHNDFKASERMQAHILND